MTARWEQRHTWFLIGGVIIILLLIVLGMRQRGADVKEATHKLVTADTMHVKAELVINLPERIRGRERLFTKITTMVEGDVKRGEDRTPELTGNLYVEGRGSGNVLFADGQVRILRDRVLFNLDNLPVLLNSKGNLKKRWTEVAVPLFTENNPAQIREALIGGLSTVQKAGTETVDGEKLVRYSATLTEEQENQLANTLRQGTSGSRAAHVITRLLDANRVQALDVWVDKGNEEVRRVQAHFVRPLSEGREFDFALLNLTFTDYGKDVAIDVPERQLMARPEAFANLFGRGQVEEVTVEESNNE